MEREEIDEELAAPKVAALAACPEGAGRMPRFLQELAARSQMTEADWAD
jgi:hypothetical protein